MALMVAAALKKCYDNHTHLRKKTSVEEQRAQKNDRFLRRRQIACLIYDYFCTTGSYDEIQGLPGLFNNRLENDDIQDFDLRWEHKRGYEKVMHHRTKFWKVCKK